MTPEKLDALIFAALSEGPCALNELARRVGHDAREVLRRLHVLGGQKQVGTQMVGGGVEWFSRRAEAISAAEQPGPSIHEPSPLQAFNRAAVTRRSPRRDTAKAAEDAPREATPPVDPSSPPTPRARKKHQPIIVRPRQRVTELRVMPINDGDAIIQAESDDEGGELGEIFVPNADIPALIRALTEAMVA